MTKEEADDVIGINPWSAARVSSVPLDFAAGLAFKGKVKGAYFRLAPAASDVQDAIEIDKIDDLAEGKVPLFYFEDFELDLKDGEELWSDSDSGSGNGSNCGSAMYRRVMFIGTVWDVRRELFAWFYARVRKLFSAWSVLFRLCGMCLFENCKHVQ
jgi:hypothetical protein